MGGQINKLKEATKAMKVAIRMMEKSKQLEKTLDPRMPRRLENQINNNKLIRIGLRRQN